MERKTKITGNIWIISIIINVVLDVSFGYLFGIVGIAVTTLLINISTFLITLYYSFKYIRCNFYFKFIAKVIYSGFFMAIALYLLNPFGPVNIILSGVFSFLLYLFVLWLFGGIKKEEIKFFMNVIKEIIIDSYKSIRGLS